MHYDDSQWCITYLHNLRRIIHGFLIKYWLADQTSVYNCLSIGESLNFEVTFQYT